MPARPVVIIHGYSDEGKNAARWCEELKKLGYDTRELLHVVDYVSLSNEVTIKDIAEGFDRALRIQAGLDQGQEFDAIVHSTGMLVIRAWLVTYERGQAQARSKRLKHLIGLAPATFGSPMAHKGRSTLGAVFKGNRRFGPDFMEAGDVVLSGLELASAYTWKLAHADLLSERAVFGPNADTPYPFIFVGLKDYGLLKRVATEPGTDGTVRWAGCGFNVRQINVDLTQEPSDVNRRVTFGEWSNTRVPLVLLPDYNHGSIFGEPKDDLVGAVREALAVESEQEYREWARRWEEPNEANRQRGNCDRWQQFITHLVDERGDGIPDYYVELYTVNNAGEPEEIDAWAEDVHAWREDPSYRCYHVNLDRTGIQALPKLYLKLIASSGTKLVGYHGHGSERFRPDGVPRADADEGKWDAVLNLSEHLNNAPAPLTGERPNFFAPFTTTLVEIKMNREPMPLDVGQPNQVARFLPFQ